MKTVKELAVELGVSKSRIQQVIEKLPTTKKPKLVDRMYMLNDENIIDISVFIKKDKKSNDGLIADKLLKSYRQVIDNLVINDQQQVIEILKEHNKNKDFQIEQLQKLLENQQVLLLNEQKENQLLLESISLMKIPFWKKIKFFKK